MRNACALSETPGTPGTADRGRTRVHTTVQNRRRDAVRGLQPASRTDFDAGDKQLALCRVDRGPGLGAVDRGAAGSAYSPCPYPGNEWGTVFISRIWTW